MMATYLLILACLVAFLGTVAYLTRKKPTIMSVWEIDWKNQTPYHCSAFWGAVVYVADMRGINLNKPFEVRSPPSGTSGAVCLIGDKEGVAVGHVEHDIAIGGRYTAVLYSAPYHYGGKSSTRTP